MPLLEDDIAALAKSHGIAEVAIKDVKLQFPNDDTLSFGEWFGSVKDKKPHWLKPEPAVAGDELYSIKAQTDFLKTNGEQATIAHLAQFGLRLGNIKKREAVSSGTKDEPSSANPWAADFKGSKELAEKKRAEIIKMDTGMARRLAAKAGARIDGRPLIERQR
jgi:hypothetical protein